MPNHAGLCCLLTSNPKCRKDCLNGAVTSLNTSCAPENDQYHVRTCVWICFAFNVLSLFYERQTFNCALYLVGKAENFVEVMPPSDPLLLPSLLFMISFKLLTMYALSWLQTVQCSVAFTTVTLSFLIIIN